MEQMACSPRYIINVLNFCKDKKYYYVIVYQIFILR